MLCTECEKRDECKELCEEARLYADQDEIEQQELTVPDPQYSSGWPGILRTDEERERSREAFEQLSKRQKQFVMRWNVGLGKKEICQELGITEKNYTERLSQFKKKMENRDVLPKYKGREIVNEPMKPRPVEPAQPKDEVMKDKTIQDLQDLIYSIDLKVHLLPGPVEVEPHITCTQEMVKPMDLFMEFVVMPVVKHYFEKMERAFPIMSKGIMKEIQEIEKEEGTEEKGGL